MTTNENPVLPEDVVALLRRCRDFYWRIAEQLPDEIYADEGNRQGMSIDCDAYAEFIDVLLHDYGYLSAIGWSAWQDEVEAVEEGEGMSPIKRKRQP